MGASEWGRAWGRDEEKSKQESEGAKKKKGGAREGGRNACLRDHIHAADDHLVADADVPPEEPSNRIRGRETRQCDEGEEQSDSPERKELVADLVRQFACRREHEREDPVRVVRELLQDRQRESSGLGGVDRRTDRTGE